MKKFYCISIILFLFFSFFLFSKNEFVYHASKWIQNNIELEIITYLDSDRYSQWIDDDRPTLIYKMPPKSCLGDIEALKRILLSAKSMGWNVLSTFESKFKSPKKLKNAFGLFIFDELGTYSQFPNKIPLFKINWIVDKKYTKSPEKYIDFLKISPPNPRVQGILITSYYPLNLDLSSNNRIGNLKFIMTWYPTVKSTNYEPKPNELMYFGTKYTNDIRGSQKYSRMQEKLDKTGYFYVYGEPQVWKDLKSFQSFIPTDGESFVKKIHQHGICLVLHNDRHLTSGSPSGRIFEAAAAAAVIISDKHPFIIKEFKDSVLYIDQTREDLFEQIDAHMRWIKANPEEAKAKARLAHEIFLKKFTLEQQLDRLYQHIAASK